MTPDPEVPSSTPQTEAESCPSCKSDLRGDPIPEAQRESYGAAYFLRAISIYDRETDRTVAWRCPDCGHQWARGSKPSKRHNERPYAAMDQIKIMRKALQKIERKTPCVCDGKTFCAGAFACETLALLYGDDDV